MKRLLLFTLVLSVAYTPVAFADGPLVASARRAAHEMATADAHQTSVAAVGGGHVALAVTRGETARLETAAATQDSDGMSARQKTWLGIGMAAVLTAIIFTIDGEVENNTPSALGLRADGCSFLC